MNVDIVTEHVAMRPEWHDIFDAWLQRCRRLHPDVDTVDLTLRHADLDSSGEAVDLTVCWRGRRLHSGTRATDMGTALWDALEVLDRELALNEAIRPAAKHPH